MRSGWALFALVLLSLLSSSAAWGAGPSAADVATGRELYKQGADALDQNKPDVAADKLSQAWALVQTPVIGFDLARAHVALGHLVEAREAALAVSRLATAPNETARSTEARTEATKLAAQLEPRIPHVSIKLEGLAGHEATVKLDGSVVPMAAIAVARQANPGPHLATVETDDGRKAEGSITLAEGETKTIAIQLDAPRADAPPPKHGNVDSSVIVAPPVIEAPKQEKTGGLSPLVWIGVGTIGVGALVGTITGAMALSEASTVKQHCSTVSTTGDGKTVCPPPYDGNLSSAGTLSAVSTVAFVIAALGIPVLVTGFVLSGKSKSAAAPAPSARVVPFFGPTSGIAGVF